MFCEKCGTQLEDTDKFCPKCGTPAPVSTDAPVPSGQPENNTQAAAPVPEQPKEDALAVTAGSEQPKEDALAVTACSEQPKEDTQTVTPASEQPKDNKQTAAGAPVGKKAVTPTLFKVLIIAGALVAVFLVAIIANAARIGNFVHKTFSSPEKYYQYVEKKNAEELASIMGDIYKLYVLDRKDYFQTTSSAKITVELDEAGQDILELSGLAGVDLSWLKSASVDTSATFNGDKVGVNLSTAVNKDDILSLAMVLDMVEGEAYFQIPELTDQYIGLDLKEISDSSDFDDLLDEWEDLREEHAELYSVLPSQAKLEKLLNKYFKVALNCVEDVEKKSKVLKVEGVSQKCTVLKVTLDNRTLAGIFGAILDEAEKDKALEALIVEVVDASGEDGDDAYEEFLDELKDLQRRYKSDRNMEDIKMTVYVDGKGNVVGRELEADGITISLLMPEKGNKFGYEFSVKSGKNKYALTGSGKRSGDKLSGELNMRYNGTSILGITADKFDIETLKRGQMNGRLEISLGSGIGKVAGSVSGLSVLQDMKFDISAKSSGHSLQYSFGVTYDDEKLGTLSVAAEEKRASGVKIPGEKNVVMVEDIWDLEDWFDSIAWDKVVSRLEKTDLPKDAVDFVEDLGESIEESGLENVMNNLMYILMLNYYRYY